MTSSTTPKTILLRGDPLASEGIATGAAITPGMAVAPSGGNVARAGVNAVAPGFAREADIVGRGIGDDYAIGERVLYWSPRKGDWFYAWLGTSEEIVAGDLLECGANGVLVDLDGGPAVARALEAVTTTSEIARIKVEVV